jgi:hypothetical protein
LAILLPQTTAFIDDLFHHGITGKHADRLQPIITPWFGPITLVLNPIVVQFLQTGHAFFKGDLHALSSAIRGGCILSILSGGPIGNNTGWFSTRWFSTRSA